MVDRSDTRKIVIDAALIERKRAEARAADRSDTRKALEARAKQVRIVGLTVRWESLPLVVQDALYGLAAELDDAAALEAERATLREALDALEDDALALLDQHVSPEVHKETRLRIIERIAARAALVSGEAA